MAIESMARVLQMCTLQGTAKLVLLGIANHDGDGGSWPSIATLAKYASVTERNAQKAVDRLIEDGWITCEVQGGGNRATRGDRRPNLYHIVWTRLDGVSLPTDDVDGVSDATSRGVATDVDGVSVATPEPSLEPSMNPTEIVDAVDDDPLDGEIVDDDGPLPAVVMRSGHLDEARRLCDVMAALLVERGHKASPSSKRWLLDMEALLRIDEREPGHVERVLRWLHAGRDDVSAFWRGNVLSPGKLRLRWSVMAEQYERMRKGAPRNSRSAALHGHDAPPLDEALAQVRNGGAGVPSPLALPQGENTP